MSLRDILHSKKDFSAFKYDLHQAIKNNPEMSQQALGDSIAKALGARSSEALPFHSDAPQQAPESLPVKEPRRLYIVSTPEGMTPNLASARPGGISFRHVRDMLAGDDGALAYEDDGMIKLFASRTSKAAQSTLADCEAFINDEAWPLQLRELSTIRDNTVSDFLEDLELDAQRLKDKYDARMGTDTSSWSAYPHAGLTRNYWEAECRDGNTMQGYWDWVVSQLEQRLDTLIYE